MAAVFSRAASSPGSYVRSALVAVAAVTLIATVLMTAYQVYDVVQLDEAHAFECDGCVRPPGMLTLSWLGGVAMTTMLNALVALPAAGIYVVVLWVLERLSPVFRTLTAWLLVGLVLATPLALVLWLLSQMGDCFTAACHRRTGAELILPILLYALTLTGGYAAWATRYRWRA